MTNRFRSQFALVACVALSGCGSDAAPGGASGTASGGAGPGAGGMAGASAMTGGAGGVPTAAGGAATGGNGGAPASSGGTAGAASGGAAGSGTGGTPSVALDSVWSDLTVMAVENPKDHGAIGDGTTDDLNALGATVDALPAAGGIVYLPEGATFRKTDVLVVTKDHVKLWAPNGQGTIYGAVAGQRRHQSTICRNTGCGFFGVKFTSDATERFDALEDNQISADHGRLVEVAGCEVAGSAAAGIFLFGSTEHYIEGNYVHHTWADHIHHTEGAQQSWVWGNYVFNELPSKGDDGVACVTYGPASPRCGDMEWWKNTILHTEWGRGYAVIGGNDIFIHDNLAIGVAGAGIIVASEPPVKSFNSASSHHVDIRDNVVTGSGHAIGHPGILVSGENPDAEPLDGITFVDNVSANNQNGAYRAEGQYTNVTNTGMKTAASDLPQPLPTQADAHVADTTVLRTRDTSHVGAEFRAGLYRIHVRRAPGGAGFQQRFEYLVQGAAGAVTDFAAARTAAGDYVSRRKDVAGTSYALVLTKAPITIPGGLGGVPFRDLRKGDLDGTLSDLWQVVDSGDYAAP